MPTASSRMPLISLNRAISNSVAVVLRTALALVATRGFLLGLLLLPGIRIVAKAIDQDHLIEAQDEARVLLRSFRHLRPGQDDNFSLFASETFVNLWERLTATIAAMAVGIVSVVMVVGGIVIMNIMLAVVTHEIGIRKSLGARRRDILNQYLVESSVLAGAGGLLGVGVAWVIAIAVRNITPVPMVLPWSSVMMGVGLSAVVGLFFGIYPARQAFHDYPRFNSPVRSTPLA
jgi:putative ABC transport system permease protein